LARFQSLTIFFPMWNEELCIHTAISAAQEVCEELCANGEIGEYELLIINDASTDRTGAIAEELASANPRIRVIHHAKNRKLGGSLKSGFAAAKGELILYTDADAPFDLAELHKACRLMRVYNCDIVTAYRHDRTSEGPRRFIYSFIYNWIIRFFFGLYLRDVNFAFKLYNRRIFKHIQLVSEGSFISAELLIRASRLGYRIMQFGVDFFPRTRGVSTLSSPAVIVKMLLELMVLWYRLRQVKPLPAHELGQDAAVEIEKS
jgi:glycosyltransferase involved in cell wall biosynthesis